MKYKNIFFVVILLSYSLLYIATSYRPLCEDDCDRTVEVYQQLRTNRDYVYGVYRCTQPRPSDTLCILVRDTTGINWNLFADTACTIASQNGLPGQKIFVLKDNTIPYDTLARKICP